ncbi:glycosyltransferase family 57 protein [Auriscalpium vulgare]|uniref:Glycosyltransferase family 57 protein n=1 Tax=Auriscalpium vulgare TaxID=40419 RepID=A0ACB8S1P3_9AGAM|nr:glycosyltransferase family 57 protein [Auriscalpium vulgare]
MQGPLDIVAPIPRRHSALQPLPDLWARTPSPASSRAVSPTSSRHLFPSGHRYHSFSVIDEAGDKAPRAREQDGGERGGMGRRWVRWMLRSGLREWVVPSAVLASLLVKWTLGLGSYSGEGTPPMYGDYEAQRHWMELTVHLPFRQWYTYDLQYWGLDYPPLTAYHSWLCGLIGSWVNPAWFALDASRGMEEPSSKLFMRATVLASDALVYVPALWMFTRVWHASRSRRTQNIALLTLLFQPALLLIDFGHFQYNSVMLGFTLLAINFFIRGQDLRGAVFFTLSLGFKQMALYYAPAVGSYLIGKCLYLGPKDGGRLFIRLALVTTLSFIIIFLPFLPPFAPISSILDPITRIFPFARGIFEDKVANFWCASNVVVKWNRWASRAALLRLSTLFTVIGFLGAAIAPVKAWLRLGAQGDKAVEDGAAPSVMHPVILLALLNSSVAFFLYSFQVHEKTILLPMLPLTLLMSAAPLESTTFKLAALANNVGVFSMWPLLRRDGQAVQYIGLLLFWNRLTGHNPFSRGTSLMDILTVFVYAACLSLHLLELVYSPPARYPDLFPVLNVLISTPVFFFVWLWSIKSIMEARWAAGGLSLGDKDAGPPSVDGDAQTPVVEHSTSSALQLPLRGIGRERGLRAQSLGFAAGRRVRTGSKAASVNGGD